MPKQRKEMSPEELEVARKADASRKQKSRQRQREEKEAQATDGESVSDMWARLSRQIREDDPALHQKLLERHETVTGLEAEVDEIVEGVQNGLRAETRTLATADSNEIFPMPDVCFKDVKAEAASGTLHYHPIESAETFRPVPGEKYKASKDGVTEYRFFGFRTRLHSETLQRSRESLVLYALQTRDANLDWAVVEQAISDCQSYNGFSPNADRLNKLIRQYRGLPPTPPLYVTLTASDGYQQTMPPEVAALYTQERPFMSPAQLKRWLEGRANLELHIGRAFESPHARMTPTAAAIRDAAELLQRRQEERK